MSDNQLILFVDGKKEQAILHDELSAEIGILKGRGGSVLDYEIGYDSAAMKANDRIATLELALQLIQKDYDDGTTASDTITFKVQGYIDRAEKELKEATDE